MTTILKSVTSKFAALHKNEVLLNDAVPTILRISLLIILQSEFMYKYPQIISIKYQVIQSNILVVAREPAKI